MDGNALAASVARLIAARGEAITLRRLPATDVACRAAVWQFKPDELVGDLKQGDRRVVMSNLEIVAAAWPGPPSLERKDRIIIGTKTFTIIEVDTRRINDVIAGHWVIIRG